VKSRNSPSDRLEHQLNDTDALEISVHAVKTGLLLLGGREDAPARQGTNSMRPGSAIT
jgi:hypothetical protein